MTRIIQASEGQTLSDIAVQEMGDVERRHEIAILNGMGITDDLMAGMDLLVPDADPDRLHIVAEFARVNENGRRVHRPASGLTAEDKLEQRGGIGYMGVQINFKVY